MTTSGAAAATISVDGVPRNDWGMWQSMEPGTYTVSYESVVGLNTPAAQTAVVTAGILTEVVGAYTPAAVTPDAPSAPVVGSDAAPGGPVAAVVRGSE